jgi:hypothetical protein
MKVLRSISTKEAYRRGTKTCEKKLRRTRGYVHELVLLVYKQNLDTIMYISVITNLQIISKKIARLTEFTQV